MGAEYNRWSARVTPRHNVTLAFTRMLAGPMDYTPGGFDNVTRENFTSQHGAALTVMGTRAHQTALFVVFESELQIVADSPAAYEGQKELEFLKAVPASWDETRVLNGVPPKYITIARRRGKRVVRGQHHRLGRARHSMCRSAFWEAGPTMRRSTPTDPTPPGSRRNRLSRSAAWMPVRFCS